MNVSKVLSLSSTNAHCLFILPYQPFTNKLTAPENLWQQDSLPATLDISITKSIFQESPTINLMLI